MRNTLRSFSFGTYKGFNELPDEVLNLFKELSLNPQKKIEYAYEIISSGLQGGIDFNKEFSINAFETTVRKNQYLVKEGKRKKEYALDFTDRNNQDDIDSAGLVNVDVATVRAVDKVQDAYEQILLDDELSYAVSTIKELSPVLLVEEGIDIILTLKQALLGVPDSVSIIKLICDKYEIVAEQIKTVLSSGYSFEEIFAQ